MADVTRYIGDWGTDTPNDSNDGSLAHPWATIQHGITQGAADSGSGYTVQLEIASGNYSESVLKWNTTDISNRNFVLHANGTVNVTCTDGVVYLNYKADSCNITIQGLSITATGLTSTGHIFLATDGTLTMADCTIDTTATGQRCIYIGHEASLTLTNCTVSCYQQLFTIYGGSYLEIDGGTYTAGNISQSYLFSLWNTSQCDRIIVKNAVFSSPASTFWYGYYSDSNYMNVDYTYIGNNTITTSSNGITIRRNSGTVIIEDNVFTCSGGGFLFGSDDNPWTYTIGKVVCLRNKITAGTGHALALLDGANNCEIIGNKILNGNYAVVIKGQYNKIIGNQIKGHIPIYLVGTYDGTPCIGNLVVGNSCYADSGSACIYGSNAQHNTVIRNIFHGGSGSYAITDNGTNLHGKNFFDENCYYAGASGLFDINSTTGSTLASLQAVWLNWDDGTNGFAIECNDVNCIVADPQYKDISNNDFSLRWASAVIDVSNNQYTNECLSFGVNTLRSERKPAFNPVCIQHNPTQTIGA